MYPLIIIGNLHIYVFGIFMAIAWIVFFYALHRFSLNKGITKHIFTNIVPFTLSIFIFGRIFYILNEWREQKFIFQNLLEGGGVLEFLKNFFITENYSLSLAGGIFGFFLVFLFYTQGTQKKNRLKYIDVIAPAFLIAGIIAYIGALLGGQIYGISSDAFYAIQYTHKYSPIPFQKTLFPLPILYIIIVSGLVALYFRLTRLEAPAGYIGYLLFGLYGLILFILEFTNGAEGMFETYIKININQVIGILFAIYGFLGITSILKKH